MFHHRQEEDALLQNISSCNELGKILGPTLGPMGMDIGLFERAPTPSEPSFKLITNDGATLMKNLRIEHPACQLLSRAPQLQDVMVGDGTTSVMLLTNELLQQAKYLIEQRHMHPSNIIRGYQLASEKSKVYLQRICQDGCGGNGDEEMIRNVIRTSMQSKIISQYEETFVELICKVDKQRRSSEREFKLFYCHSVGNDMGKSVILDGMVLEELKHVNMKQFGRKNVNVLICKSDVLNGNFISKTFNTKISTIESNDYKKLTAICDQLIEQQVHVIFNVGFGIHKIVQEYMKERGVLCVSFLDFKTAHNLSIVCNCSITSNIKNNKQLGHVSELNMLSESTIEIKNQPTGKYNWNCIKIVGPSLEICNEIQRSIHDCVTVLNKSSKVVAGGGASFVSLAKYIRKLEYPNSLQLILEAYANALEVIPMILCKNIGYDASNILSQLRTTTQEHVGVNLDSETICNQLENQVVEPLQLIESLLDRSFEFSEMILRIDENIYIKPIQLNPLHQ